MSDEAHIYLHCTANKQKFRHSSAAISHELPVMNQTLFFVVLFGPEESFDPIYLRMKTDKPLQSHRNV
jgi:hypothetical protein